MKNIFYNLYLILLMPVKKGAYFSMMRYISRKCYHILLFAKSVDNPYLLDQIVLVHVLMGSKISYKIDSNVKININLFIWTNGNINLSNHLGIIWDQGY